MSLSGESPYRANDGNDVRTIDAIADHVLAARYLSAEGRDGELNRLLDLVLVQIGRTIAAQHGHGPDGISTS